MVLPSVSYYPYHFEHAIAAYLLPPDIKKGERVWLEDVIEDIVAKSWNQGVTSRLHAAKAIWNGEDFEIQFKPKDVIRIIG